MISAILDTAILVDLLRAHLPAIIWFRQQGDLAFGITPLVRMELIQGADNRAEQRRALRLTEQFEMVYPTKEDIDWAMQRQLPFRLSHHVSLTDCLIASAAQRLQLPLYTLNLKHFRPLLGELAQMPY